MKIGITGASGFIGKKLAALAEDRGHEVISFSRTPHGKVRKFSTQERPDVSGLDAVLNLAGESILGLWTEKKKRGIIESRGEGTNRIVEAMAAATDGPRILINASAIGFYGDTGENIVDETSEPGTGFLAETCQAWEGEAWKAEAEGIRVVTIRIGFVLGAEGAMKLIKPVFSLGLGGPLGTGRQWMSGIHVDDVAGLFLWAAENSAIRGPVNAVMPAPFRNSEFTKAVAEVLHRPAIIPAPAFVMKAALGELSHLLLDNVRVVPNVALEEGYAFRYPDLKSALEDALA